jgi:sec-independent protein translocase protein TatA
MLKDTYDDERPRMRFGIMEMIIIFAVLLLFFGASRLPNLGSSLGSAIRNFKRGFTGDESGEAPEDDKKPASLAGSPPLGGSTRTATKTPSKEA